MSAAPPLKLKIRTAAGDKLITEGLTKQSTLADLKRRIEQLCQIPVDQQQLSTNYPPPARVITAADSTTLAELKIISSDLLLLKQIEAPVAALAPAQPSPSPSPSPSLRSSPAAPLPASLESLSHLRPLRVHAIANDNSCLFNSVGLLMEGVENSHELITELRQTVATVILADAHDTYNEAFLGSTKQVYAETIMKKDTWGGGIELAILADFWDIEIAALDVESCHQYVFGQSEDAAQQKSKRIYLVYYGVHYDALEDDDVHGPPRRIFHPSDQSIASRALLAARQLQAAGSFTNVSKFTLRCSDCQAGLVGAIEAQEHAKATGHANFEEYAK